MELKMKNNDNRMEWIRTQENIKNKENKEEETYYVTYELASECRIPGLLKYGNFTFAPIAISEPNPKLYPFILKIEMPQGEKIAKSNNSKYGFKYGIIGELLSLFSIFLQSRFFLISTTYGELTDSGIPARTNNKFAYIAPNKQIDKALFSTGNKKLTKLSKYLDKVKLLDSKYHNLFILSCYNYSLAVKEIGVDHEMAFVRLVSAIEALSSKFIDLDEKEDILKNKNIISGIDKMNLDKSELNALKNIFQNRNIQKRFIKFIELYSKGYFKGGNYKAKNLRIKKSNLNKTLKTIYTARSKYLHLGESMYLSLFIRGFDKWDIDPTLGAYIGSKYFKKSNKLPYVKFFEGLVRHCILNFLEQNLIKNQ